MSSLSEAVPFNTERYDAVEETCRVTFVAGLGRLFPPDWFDQAGGNACTRL